MAQLWFSSALLPEGWASAVRLTLADGLITRIDLLNHLRRQMR